MNKIQSTFSLLCFQFYPISSAKRFFPRMDRAELGALVMAYKPRSLHGQFLTLHLKKPIFHHQIQVLLRWRLFLDNRLHLDHTKITHVPLHSTDLNQFKTKSFTFTFLLCIENSTSLSLSDSMASPSTTASEIDILKTWNLFIFVFNSTEISDSCHSYSVCII